MDKFKSVEISDRAWVNQFLNQYHCYSLEYNFTTLFIWSDIYHTKISNINNCLVVSFGKDNKTFLFPVGKSGQKETIDVLLADYKNITFSGLVEEHVEFLEKNYPDTFEFKMDRNMSDYIYTTESLMTLTGKKLSSKRNHINRFIENNPDWRYEKITDGNIDKVNKMHDKWCDTMDYDKKKGLESETIAVKKALKYFNELGLSGGILISGDKPVAFAIGDRLNDKTFLVHIEKAFHDIQGAYPMINKQFVTNNCSEFEFVNREEDAGDEGLRKAKLSYNPYCVLTKYTAVLKK